MFKLSKRIFLMIVGLIGLHICPGAQAEDCSAILANGTFDVTSSNADKRDVQAYLNYLNRGESGSSSQSQQKDMDLGATYGGFGGSFGEKSGTANAQEYKNYLKTLETSDAVYESHVYDFVSAASRVISEHWLACMSRTGLHASVKYTANPDEMILMFTSTRVRSLIYDS